MEVRDLIKELLELPQSSSVVLESEDGKNYEITEIAKAKYKAVIILKEN